MIGFEICRHDGVKGKNCTLYCYIPVHAAGGPALAAEKGGRKPTSSTLKSPGDQKGETR